LLEFNDDAAGRCGTDAAAYSPKRALRRAVGLFEQAARATAL